jgi:UDP:flavonoid glycosyltransferase YjiC (YdhE family)
MATSLSIIPAPMMVEDATTIPPFSARGPGVRAAAVRMSRGRVRWYGDEPPSFVLTCHDAGGTVPPMLAIAEALVHRGHDVVLLSQPSVRERAEAAGCTFAAFSVIPDYDRDTMLEEQLALVTRAITGKIVGDDALALANHHDADALGPAPTAAEIASAIEEVLADTRYRENALAVARTSRDGGGAQSAAADIEMLVASASP